MSLLEKSIKHLAVCGYVVIKNIGSGSNGEVFKARHTASKKIVAIKMLQNIFSNPIPGKYVVSEI